jgi:predicted metal-dependent hydrolase
MTPPIPTLEVGSGVLWDWNAGALAEGLGCYAQGEFFLAHEHWEAVWLRLREPEKNFLQALIQLTAAFHHLQAGNRAGAVSLLRRTRARLERCPACFGGIAAACLRDEVSEWLRALESGAAILPEVLPAALPKIRPVDRPAEE